MPKQIDYPRASMKNCMLIGNAVNDLGGACSAEMAAEKLNKQYKSGHYSALVGSAVKFGLISNKKGQLSITQLYRDIKLAYDETEAQKENQKAFLTPPLFASIFERFENKPLPLSHFDKLLIREHGVPDNVASRVSKYFIEGAKECGLLGEGNILARSVDSVDEIIENGENNGNKSDPIQHPVDTPNVHSITPVETSHPAEEEGKFSVRIKGPGMDSLIVVNEEEDLLIVKAMLKKVEKRLAAEDN